LNHYAENNFASLEKPVDEMPEFIEKTEVVFLCRQSIARHMMSIA